MRLSCHRLLSLALLLSCQKAKPEPSPEDPPQSVRDTYNSAEKRLTDRFLDRGLVVSLGGDGHKGDSLLWSGVALGSLGCDAGQPVLSGLTELAHTLGGGLARHWDLLGQVSLDGALGFYFGVAARLKNCPEETLMWASLLKGHQTFMAAHGGAINGNGFLVPPAFDFVAQALFGAVGLQAKPQMAQLETLASEVSDWALAVKAEHQACYRIHISWLALRTAELLGYGVPRDAFCANSAGTGLAVVDQWCGRSGLQAFISGFQYNTWQYKHERCPAWETPDGNGFETPAVDYLIGLTQYYKL